MRCAKTIAIPPSAAECCLKARVAACSSHGFTLVEVIVSLTLITIIGSLAVSGLRTGMEITGKGSQVVRDMNRSQTILRIIEAQVRGALPMRYSVDRSYPQLQIAFTGDRHRLKFVSNNSLTNGPDGFPRWIELDWQDSSSSILRMREFRILPPYNTPESIAVNETDLLPAAKVEFGYLQRSRGTEPARWLESWRPEDQRELPAAVRLRIERRGDSTELLIPVEMAANSWQGLWLP